jgi:hypothetical protein
MGKDSCQNDPSLLIWDGSLLMSGFLDHKKILEKSIPDTKIFGDLTIFTSHFKQPKLV